MHRVVDEQLLRRFSRCSRSRTRTEACRRSGRSAERPALPLIADLRLAPTPDSASAPRWPFFTSERSACLTIQLAPGTRRQPTAANRDREVRVVLADVVQVVGHGALHIALRVVLEEFEQRDHRARVLLKRAQARRPRETRPGPLRNEPPHMDVLVARPLDQARVGLAPGISRGRHGCSTPRRIALSARTARASLPRSHRGRTSARRTRAAGSGTAPGRSYRCA